MLAFLAFAPAHATSPTGSPTPSPAHATPVGSGTVARTERIPVEQRAEAAVIAWLRHQTTAYDPMSIPRVKGKRREVRRMLAARSKALLDAYRTPRRCRPRHLPLCGAPATPRRTILPAYVPRQTIPAAPVAVASRGARGSTCAAKYPILRHCLHARSPLDTFRPSAGARIRSSFRLLSEKSVPPLNSRSAR